MTIKDGSIYLRYKEFSETRNIWATELICGHYVIPELKRKRYLQTVFCPACRKDSCVVATTTWQEGDTILTGGITHD